MTPGRRAMYDGADAALALLSGAGLSLLSVAVFVDGSGYVRMSSLEVELLSGDLRSEVERAVGPTGEWHEMSDGSRWLTWDAVP